MTKGSLVEAGRATKKRDLELCFGRTTSKTVCLWKHRKEDEHLMNLWVWLRRFPGRKLEVLSGFFQPPMVKYRKRKLNFKKEILRFKAELEGLKES